MVSGSWNEPSAALLRTCFWSARFRRRVVSVNTTSDCFSRAMAFNGLIEMRTSVIWAIKDCMWTVCLAPARRFLRTSRRRMTTMKTPPPSAISVAFQETRSARTV